MSVGEKNTLLHGCDNSQNNGINESQETSTQSTTSRVFRTISDEEAKAIHERLVNAYGEKIVSFTYWSLNVTDQLLPSKLSALFHKAHQMGQNYPNVSSLDETISIDGYALNLCSAYLDLMAEAADMNIFWDAVIRAVPYEMQIKMNGEEFSDKPEIQLQMQKEYLQKNSMEWGCVTKLNLEESGLTTLPKEIGLFTNLKILDLSDNELTTLPQEISKLKQLKILDLSNNKIQILPNIIGELESLIILDIDSNNLKSLPEEFTQLKKLTKLNLANNNLERLPERIGSLASLQVLMLENNNLQSLPNSIGKLKSLEMLYLYNNNVTSLPESMIELSNLRLLSAPNNQIEKLPREIGKMKALKIIVLDRNRLEELPTSLIELSNLDELHVNRNRISNFPKLPIAVYLGLEGNIGDSPIDLAVDQLNNNSDFENKYSRLGDSKWKECIDGEYHCFGKMVFDEGKHGGNIEPGFLQSMLNLFLFLQVNWKRRLNADFYLEMHKIACAHFQGSATETLMGKDGIGIFRDEGVSAKFASPNYTMSEEAIKEFDEISERLSNLFGSSFSLGEIRVVDRDPMTWVIDYHPFNQDQVAMVFDLFVNEFHCELLAASHENEKFAAVAKLIQLLEWLHPPLDGAGRTDTALMNFLLSKYFKCPLLMDFPYLSSCRSLKELVPHLIDGMHAWKDEVDNINQENAEQ